MRALGGPLLGLLLGLTSVACSTDPCALLIDKTCGDDDQCVRRSACQQARALQQDAVTTACEAALDNELGYPSCRL